jgi:lipid-A-disaccharide synthase-like uncharacterized protein
MHRIFLGLAVTNGSLLVASFILGLISMGEVRGPGVKDTWHLVHFLIGLLTTLTTLLVHSIVYTYFLGTGKWVKEVVHVYKMPEWVEAQAKKNKRKAFRFEFWSMSLIGITAWFGAASDAQAFNPTWHLLAASLTIAFNMGAFVIEYIVIVSQAQLLIEVKKRADQQRQALYGADPVGSPS